MIDYLFGDLIDFILTILKYLFYILFICISGFVLFSRISEIERKKG